MALESECRRVLVAAAFESQQELRGLFASADLERWQTAEAECYSQARFLLQHGPFDLVLVDDTLLKREGIEGLAWLVAQRNVPVMLLAGESAELIASAYRIGIVLCLPRRLAVEHPGVLASAMEQAVRLTGLRQAELRTREQLNQSRRQVDKLVNLIWRVSPEESEQHWFSQRYMLERLEEELARAQRHQAPLTVALGEVHNDSPEYESSPALPADWTVQTIVRGKRRCDVVGQYGMQGFLLILVHTPIQGGIQCCRRLREILEQPPAELSPPHHVRAYFGLSSTTCSRSTVPGLLTAAEQSLDAALQEPGKEC